MRYVFDIETNGLYDDVSEIHSVVAYNLDTGEILSATNNPGYTPLEDAYALLAEADLLVGHNIVGYDLPVLRKLVPCWETKATIMDTMLLSRLVYPNIKDLDFSLMRKGIQLKELTGRHSLEAWGVRLGESKGGFAKETDWVNWSPEMQTYCEQDVLVNVKLWKHFEALEYSKVAVQLEMDFAKIIDQQVKHGWPFDIPKAEKLTKTLMTERMHLENKLREVFRPWYKKGKPFTPKRDNRKMGYIAGAEMTKVLYTEFNPGSRDHIADRLTTLFGWEPDEWTKDGKPKLDDEIISDLPYDEAKLIGRYLMLTKRLGQLAEGNAAWLKMVQSDGRIHGGVITNGAVTGRCTHIQPNVAQVPAVSNAKGKVPYGRECRELFIAMPGYKVLGWDASGLELRMLAHYLYRYDGGKYLKEVLSGDIHTVNQQAAGLPTRDLAKRFIYAWLYGAGPQLIGSLVLPEGTAEEQRKKGIQITKKFLRNIPAIKRLKDDITRVIDTRGHLTGLDGRRLKIRSKHSALNMLLQGAGAVLMKKATVLFWENLCTCGYVFGREVAQVVHCHDEAQCVVIDDDTVIKNVGDSAINALKEAGEFFNLNAPMTGEVKVGNNWSETH